MKALVVLFCLIGSLAFAQEKIDEKLPYYEIPDFTVDYNAGSATARMVDGLGSRYYWASEGLREEDLTYKPSESGRTSAETIDHIYGLSKFILGAVKIESNKTKDEEAQMTFAEKRKQTLLNFEMTAELLRRTEDLSQFDNERFKFWNIINGPIADAIWHCGQVVLLRRASGNPFNSKASVFSGKVRQ